ncbi:hypothetical protein GGU10DRAFT_136473 [Lentinula aff. detonsa]|uniref:Uncharacterized protein n=1 Tax=Lentinula aff. detonsa TaxID=2804958 RepID=A0AA38KBW4_9AGAR|nr:hypothetical protein GGU10DRAFT_136473 [Lentinula aff. detonsa]
MSRWKMNTQAGPPHRYTADFHVPKTHLYFSRTTMKFFTCVSFFLLLMTGATTVNAVASTATKACSRLHQGSLNVKVNTPCKFWQSNGHAVDGTCQKRNGHHIFHSMTCVPGGSSTSSPGASSPSATSSAAVLPSSTASTDTSGASSTGDGTGSDGTGSDGMGSDGTS